MRSRTRPIARRARVRAGVGTRERLLTCAGRAFAARGFEGTTVREVCRLARANVAAVHYHFGSKADLYLETLRFAMELAHAADTAELLTFAARDDLSRSAKLVGTIRRFALGMLSPRPDWRLSLIMRELTSPTAALDRVIEEFLAPRFDALRRAIAPYLAGEDARSVDLHTMSVVGQILYHRVAAPVALRYLGERAYGPALAGRIVDHVAAFTLRSLEARASGRRRARGDK